MKKLSMLLALLLLLCCLAGCGGAGKSADQRDAEGLCTYTVSCLGQNGERVEGVMINFCTDSMCTPVISDEQGEAVFTGPAEAYHVQIVTVPEGWELAGEEEWITEPCSQSFRISFREVGK